MVVDGNAVLHRAWHALPPLKTKQGLLVNAVYGFFSLLIKGLANIQPRYVAVAFDLPEPTYRHKQYKDYKATRTKQPDELYEQIGMIKELLSVLRIPVYELPGYEADDLIGTLVNHPSVKKNKVKSVIVTGDLDALQLVNKDVKVLTLKKGISETILFDRRAVRERYGLFPKQLIDMKALAGDPSDNIKGVKGIGVKTAQKMIGLFGSLDELYKEFELDVPSNDFLSFSERVRKLLKEGKEDAFLSRDLVKIRQDAPLKFKLKEAELKKLNYKKVFEFFSRYEFKSLYYKLLKAPFPENEEAASLEKEHRMKRDYSLVETQAGFNRFLTQIKKQSVFALDTETSSLKAVDAYLIGMSFSWKSGQAVYLHFNGKDRKIRTQKWLKQLKPLLESKKIRKYGHNLKFDYSILRQYGIETRGIEFDTIIASYLLNPGSRAHKLDDLAFSFLGENVISYEELVGTGKNKKQLNALSGSEIMEYACEDADYCFRLVQPFKNLLKQKKQIDLFYEIELPLVPILAEMEINGVALDSDFLKKMSLKIDKRIKRSESQIFALSGEIFNINSQQQLKRILFDKLKIPSKGLKKIKTGLSIAAGELEKIQDKHPIVSKILAYRELIKLSTTYIKALPELVSPNTRRIHTSFNQTVTATGRLSSSDPNLQNIPIRTPLGREVRKAFVAEKGSELISADYSQIELRMIASLAGDKKMIQSFKDGADIHRETASLIYEVDPEEVTPEMRYAAKAINFGIIYGQGPFALSQATGLSFGEAKEFIEKTFMVRGKVKQYIEKAKEEARELGYVKTLYGRIRYLPDIHSNVPALRAAAERMAVNMRVQGTSADLMKKAMIAVQEWMRKKYKKQEAKMILQVHDELVFEVRCAYVESFAVKVKKIMDQAGKGKLKVPIEVEVKHGKNWGEMRRIIF